MVHIIEDLAGDWRRLDERIDAVSTEIEELVHADEGAQVADERAWHRPAHLQRHGGRHRQGRCLWQKSRFRCASRSAGQGELTKVSTATRAIPPPTRRMSIVSLT